MDPALEGGPRPTDTYPVELGAPQMLLPRPRARRWAIVFVAVMSAAIAATHPRAEAASQGVVVSVSVPSATNLDATSCAGGVVGRTSFGTVLPGSSSIMTSDCSIAFGSSNDSSALRVVQRDGRGGAMYRPPTGPTDPAFDGDGRGVVRFTGNADEPYDVAEQPDGSVVIVGESYNGANEDVALARLLADGTPDPAFGGGDGMVTTAVLAGDDYGREVEVLPDGKILVGGNAYNGINHDYVVMRYNADGTLDTNADADPAVHFSTDGILTFGIDTWSDYVDGMEVMPDGRIVLAGESWISGTQDTMSAARVMPNGTLDTSFGGGDGKVTISLQTSDWGNAVALQADGKAIIAGVTSDAGGVRSAAIVRLNVDGSLDTNVDAEPSVHFSADGLLVQSLGPEEEYATSATIQDDGKIVVAGESYVGGLARFGVFRLHPDGTLDTNADADPAVHFSTDGIVQQAVGATHGYAWVIEQQGDGGLVVAGNVLIAGTDYDFAMLRLKSDGSPDPQLDGDGIVVTPMMGTRNDLGRAMTIGADGKAILVGDAMSAVGDDDFGIIRYATTSIANFGAGNDWSVGDNAFGACLHTVAGGAVGSWPVAGSGNCTSALGANWRGIPAAAAKVATAPSSTGAAVANLRFGLRLSASQAPGGYVAPLAIEVVAPDA